MESIIAIELSYLETEELIIICRADENYKRITQKYIKIFELKDSYQLMEDEDLKYLKRVQTINLRYCDKITDRGLENLRGVQTIDLYGCNQIIDRGLENLKGVRTIN